MRIAVLAFCAVLTAGCTNLEAVRSISTELTLASESWETASGELHRSCEREYRLNEQLANCDLDRANAQGLADATEVLRVYFETLAAVAGEEAFTIDPSLSDLSGSVGSINGVNTAQVDAVGGLARLLVDVSLNARREAVLRDLIDNGGGNAQVVVDSLLKDHVAGLMRTRLQTERVQAINFYDDKFASADLPAGTDPQDYCRDRLPRSAPALQFLLVEEFCRHDTLLTEREEAIAAYEASLDDASAALTELRSNSAKLSSADLAQRLYGIGADLRASVRDVEAAFD
ncbi:MAG: hypothetical protein AAF250_12350 [Pseudomonadota bacterium]